MDEKFYAILDNFVGVDSKDSNRLISKGIMPGSLFRVKSIDPAGNSYKVTIEFLDNGKTVTETLDGKNISLYQKYDCDDVRCYDPLKDPNFKKQSQPGE